MAKMPKKPVKKNGGTKKKKPSLGKIIGGGAKTAIQKRRARERALLKSL